LVSFKNEEDVREFKFLSFLSFFCCFDTF